jgi:hypothetical protein
MVRASLSQINMIGRSVSAHALRQELPVPGIGGCGGPFLQKRGFQGRTGYAVVDGMFHELAHPVGDGGKLGSVVLGDMKGKGEYGHMLHLFQKKKGPRPDAPRPEMLLQIQ